MIWNIELGTRMLVGFTFDIFRLHALYTRESLDIIHVLIDFLVHTSTHCIVRSFLLGRESLATSRDALDLNLLRHAGLNGDILLDHRLLSS